MSLYDTPILHILQNSRKNEGVHEKCNTSTVHDVKNNLSDKVLPLLSCSVGNFTKLPIYQKCGQT